MEDAAAQRKQEDDETAAKLKAGPNECQEQIENNRNASVVQRAALEKATRKPDRTMKQPWRDIADR
jgi:hypothetical protein